MALRSSLRKLNKWHCECANNKRKTGVLFGLSASKCHRAIDLHQAECQARNCQSYTVQLLIVTKGFILKPFFQDAEIMCWRMLGHFVHKCFSFWQTILTPRDAGQHKLSTEVVTEIKNLNISPGLGKNQSKKKKLWCQPLKTTDIHCESGSETCQFICLYIFCVASPSFSCFWMRRSNCVSTVLVSDSCN